MATTVYTAIIEKEVNLYAASQGAILAGCRLCKAVTSPEVAGGDPALAALLVGAFIGTRGKF
jgi:hypothetical protein